MIILLDFEFDFGYNFFWLRKCQSKNKILQRFQFRFMYSIHNTNDRNIKSNEKNTSRIHSQDIDILVYKNKR